jgi:putative membrane protein
MYRKERAVNKLSKHAPDHGTPHDSHTCSHCEEHHGHSHDEPSRLKRTLGYLVLLFPIVTGIFLPVQTLDSSFVKAKGFSFPGLDVSADNPGFHQFLKPDTSVFYGKANYENVSKRELSAFTDRKEVTLTDSDYLKGLEAIYNFPGSFADRTIGIDGFVYKGEQTEGNHYFVFRFGFIHCVADSGVFGMLVEFPKGTDLLDDQWVHVSGTLTAEMYQPFKQTIPVLKVKTWTSIPEPSDPYVYRTY